MKNISIFSWNEKTVPEGMSIFSWNEKTVPEGMSIFSWNEKTVPEGMSIFHLHVANQYRNHRPRYIHMKWKANNMLDGGNI